MMTITLLMALTGAAVLPADEPVSEPTPQTLQWVTDISVAREMAAKEGKDILINFTGSDWCGWCKRLDGEVFSLPAFHETAGKQYVYLYLDFPRSEEAKAKVVDEDLNNKNRDDMGVDGFPTIILADSAMRPYGRTGYQPGGPEKYLEHLTELRTKGEKIKALTAADNDEQIQKLLPEAMAVMLEQNLLGHPAFEKFLTMAEKSEDAQLVAQIAQFRATQELNKLLNTPEPDFPVLVKFLQDNSKLQGPEALNALWFCSQWLTENDRKEDAKTFLNRMMMDPLVKENDRGREMIEKTLEEIDSKEVSHDHDGDGQPDH